MAVTSWKVYLDFVPDDIQEFVNPAYCFCAKGKCFLPGDAPATHTVSPNGDGLVDTCSRDRPHRQSRRILTPILRREREGVWVWPINARTEVSRFRVGDKPKDALTIFKPHEVAFRCHYQRLAAVRISETYDAGIGLSASASPYSYTPVSLRRKNQAIDPAGPTSRVT
jgi:hypothetical protein